MDKVNVSYRVDERLTIRGGYNREKKKKNIVESESDPLTREAVDLFEKEPLKGKWEVKLHTPTKFGEDPSKDLGGDTKHTNKRCSNYSMIK